MKHTKELEERIINEVQDRINSKHLDNDNEISEDEFNEIVYETMHQEIDSYLTYYSDQIEVIQELRLYDFSKMDNPQTIGQVAYYGIEEELEDRGKINDIDNYKYKTNDN
tara:strand:+ start:194 stop:523 length:330 start_codon:yes stop_codon:yes gene_type:complete